MGKKKRPLYAPRFPARTFQGTLDKFLSQKQLWRKPIAKDGSCLFRAVAEQVSPSQNDHHRVRLQCAEYIRTHQDDFKEFLTMSLDEYLGFLTDAQLWGGEVELVALSKLFGRSIIVYNEQENGVQEQVFPCTEEEGAGSADDLAKPILLAYSDGNHYDSVYTKEHKDNMAFCQAIVYSLFYEQVVQDRIPLHCRQRLKQLPESDFHNISELVNKDHSLYLLSTHYPPESITAMTSNVYHNVAMDAYRREKDCKEQQDRCIAANIQFQVGDQCQMRLPGGELCKGEVTGLNVSPGCHQVRVFQYQEEWEVPFKDITLPSRPHGQNGRHGSLPGTRRPPQQSQPPPSSRGPAYPTLQQSHPQPPPSSRGLPYSTPQQPPPQPPPSSRGLPYSTPQQPPPQPPPSSRGPPYSAPQQPPPQPPPSSRGPLYSTAQQPHPQPPPSSRGPPYSTAQHPQPPPSSRGPPYPTPQPPPSSRGLPYSTPQQPHPQPPPSTRSLPYSTPQQPHPQPPPSSRGPPSPPSRETQPHNPAPGPTSKRPAQRSANVGAESVNGVMRTREPPREKERVPPLQPKEDAVPKRSQVKQGSTRLPTTKSSVLERPSVSTSTTAARRETATKLAVATAGATAAATNTTTTTTVMATSSTEGSSALRSAVLQKKTSSRDSPTGIVTSKLASPMTTTAALQTKAAVKPQAKVAIAKTVATPHGFDGITTVKLVSPATTAAPQTKPVVAPHGKGIKTATGPLGMLSSSENIIASKHVSPVATAAVLQTGNVGVPHAKVTQKPPAQIPAVTSPRPVKTKAGPHGSLTSEDSNYSSSSDESNGNQSATTAHATANQTTGFPQHFAFTNPSQLVTDAWETDDRPVDAPRDQVPQFKPSLPKRGEAQGGPKKDSRAAVEPRLPPTSEGNPGPYFTMASVEKNPSFLDDRESPYLESKLPKVESSQPEEAWPMFDPEEPSNPILHNFLNHSSAPINLPDFSNVLPGGPFPPPPDAIAANMYEQLRNFHMQMPMGPDFMPLGPTPNLIPFPFLRVPVPVSEQAVQVSAPLKDQDTQTDRDAVPVKSSEMQTDLQDLSVGLILSEELKPPQLEGRNESPLDQLKFILSYSIQCARVYLKSNPAAEKRGKEALAMMEKFKEEGLKKLLPQAETKPEAKTKKDVKIKPLNSDEQTFIKSLSSGRSASMPTATTAGGEVRQPKPSVPLPMVATEGEVKQPKPAERQPVVAGPTAEPDQLSNPVKPAQQRSSKHVAHAQQPAQPQSQERSTKQQPSTKVSARAQPQQPNKATTAKPMQSRPPTSKPQPADQQPRPPSATATREATQTTREVHSPHHQAAKTQQSHPAAPPPSKQSEGDGKANVPPAATEPPEASKESLTPSPDRSPSGHSKEEEEEETPNQEGSGQPSEAVPQQEFVMRPYPHPHMIPPHMMMHPGARPGLVMPMPMPPPMWYPNYHIPMAAMPVMVPPFAAPHPMMAHHMMRHNFEQHEHSGQMNEPPSIQELEDDQEEEPQYVNRPSAEEGEEASHSEEEVAPEAFEDDQFPLTKEDVPPLTDGQPLSPTLFTAETTAQEKEEEGEEDEEEEMPGPMSSPEPGETVNSLPETETEAAVVNVVTGVLSHEEQVAVHDGEKSANVTGTSVPVVTEEVRLKSGSPAETQLRKSGSEHQHLPDLPCRPTKNRGPDSRGSTRSRRSGKGERTKTEKSAKKTEVTNHDPARSTPLTASTEGKESGKDPKNYTKESKPPKTHPLTRRAKSGTQGDAFAGRASGVSTGTAQVGSGGDSRASGGDSRASGGGVASGAKMARRQQQQKQPPFVAKDGQQKMKPKRYSTSGVRGNQDPTRGLFISPTREDPSDIPSATQLPSRFQASYVPACSSRPHSDTTYPSFSHTLAQDCSSSNADPWPSFESSTYYIAQNNNNGTLDSHSQCTSDCDFGELKKQLSCKRRLEAKTSPYHSSFQSFM